MHLRGFLSTAMVTFCVAFPANADDGRPKWFSPTTALLGKRVIEPAREEKPLPPLWSGGVELGITGAEGNSENFRLRLGSRAKRETPESLLTLNLLYVYATANDVNNENRLLFNGRHEWPFVDTRWSFFVSSEVEYDEFKAYDVRLGAHAGVAYRFLQTEATLLKGRLGAGGSREIGGPNNHFMPEALLGLDFEHAFSERSKLCAGVDLFPELKDWGEFRLEAKAAYELLVDPDLNLTLRLGVLDRYDSTPDGKKPNDFEYFAVLLWKF